MAKVDLISTILIKNSRMSWILFGQFPNQLWSNQRNMSRVKSKKLFNLELQGKVDSDILAGEAKTFNPNNPIGQKMIKMMKNANTSNPIPNQEFVSSFRDGVEAMMSAVFSHPTLTTAMKQCSHSSLLVPTSHYGDYCVPVQVHTPPSLSSNESAPAIVYAHGGGCVSCSASLYKPYLSSLAVETGVKVFNVDYRLAPETKCPNNAKDFYFALKYIAENAESLGIDPGRIAIAGESGGGYICFATMVILAQNQESDLVKVALPSIPMIDDYHFNDTLSMTKEERGQAKTQRKLWHLIASDLNTQRADPLLFPAKASDEILQKMPPVIMMECEFDFYITEAERMARRLRAAGRLLEMIVIPGCKHGSGMVKQYEAWEATMEAYRLAIREYLH